MYHLPVLLHRSIELLDIQPDGIYVDATFGGGGHARSILEKLGARGKLFGFDQDPDAAANVPADARFQFVPGNFRFMNRYLKVYGIRAVDGILADLGVSSHQLDEAERGFSYRFDSQLDMRMNRVEGRTAADVLNESDAGTLQRIFSEFGELRNAKTMAAAIVQARHAKPLRTVGDLLAVTEPLIRGQKWKYLSQVFQALRIEVNEEMIALESFLAASHELLKPGGRLVVISYHSLEDRMVKNFFKTGHPGGEVQKDFFGNIYRPFEIITKKAIEAESVELKSNPRSRSAKLRAAIKLTDSNSMK